MTVSPVRFAFILAACRGEQRRATAVSDVLFCDEHQDFTLRRVAEDHQIPLVTLFDDIARARAMMGKCDPVLVQLERFCSEYPNKSGNR